MGLAFLILVKANEVSDQCQIRNMPKLLPFRIANVTKVTSYVYNPAYAAIVSHSCAASSAKASRLQAIAVNILRSIADTLDSAVLDAAHFDEGLVWSPG